MQFGVLAGEACVVWDSIEGQVGMAEPARTQSKDGAPCSKTETEKRIEVEMKLLEALEIYHPAKLQGMHKHFVLFGLIEHLEKRLSRPFTPEEVLQLLERFYNIEKLKIEDEESELIGVEEDFTLPNWIREQQANVKDADANEQD
eukprot:TRINITY_DN1751_c3_g1_i1.p1 TRINITY_DN1751_c3_g1~~TRINITY_DN1751_c3_g1_i1.p1  ORF type:complete len:145 (-),score=31.56 TRINITY_DN1751_c3_g1_i1:812-1246(-)